jgi:hypothetical protein
VAVGTGTVAVFLGIGNGTFQPKTDIPMGASAIRIVLEDVNGDAARDIVTSIFANPGAVRVALNQCVSTPVFETADIRAALKIAAGLSPFSSDGVRYDTNQDSHLTLPDAVHLARKTAGLEPNP